MYDTDDEDCDILEGEEREAVFESGQKYSSESPNTAMSKRPFMAKAAEHRFVSELLLRGIPASLEIVDQGIDVIVNYNIRVQIKSASQKRSQYSWKTSKMRWNSTQLAFTDRRESPTKPDYYALWAVDHDRWFIVPLLIQIESGNGNVLWLNSKKPSAIDPYEEKWTLLGADADGKWTGEEEHG